MLLKPNCVYRGLIGEVIRRFEDKGFRMIGLKMTRPSKQMLEEFYSVHRGKQFFNELIEFMMTGPIVAFILEGPDCVKVVRNMIGATDFLQAQPGTVRGDYSLSTGKNLIHGSDSVEIATKEISLLFRKDEIQDWKSPISEYVY
mgnify:CR=1 FL=1